MNRTQFTFYESFFRSVSRIKKACDRAAAYDAICAYALYGEVPNLDKLPDSVAVAFEVTKPILDASRRKASNGKRGGEAKQTESDAKQTEANRKQTASKGNSEARENPKQEKEQEQVKEQVQDKDKEQMLSPLKGAPPFLRDAFADWLRYKEERREGYKPTGLRNLETEVMHNAERYGAEAVAQLIRHCMASNWQGIIFDRLGAAAAGSARAVQPGRKEFIATDDLSACFEP